MPTARAQRQRWQKMAARRLPAAHDVLEHNAAITATYARLYGARPELFKWAGVASFASHRVGLALATYVDSPPGGWRRCLWDVATDIGAVLRGEIDRDDLEADLGVLRATNAQVYEDLVWVHLAYLDDDGGIDAIRAALDDQPEQYRVLCAFADIERGRRLLEAGESRREEAVEVIWRGNARLLEHEQTVTVQRHFDSFEAGMEAVVSTLAWMDFELEAMLPESDWTWWRQARSWIAHLLSQSDGRLDYTSFHAYAVTRGLPQLLRKWSWPDIRSLDQRWAWVRDEVMPIWRRVDREDPALLDKIRRLAGASSPL